ncbi:MAG: phosphate ABC transporter permease subunit PstC [Actinobacteria bacterium]|nr:phosphate ABC transporter permease subunit PstC [Actinomycetota bacterium]MBU1945195.1 phosphate ABC transporter permease subunit PstC [Actinomycetota bacterium]MBU2687733.1 phosphate ABC transporter permease subunit PstC [Actinomycetota bacterium]
MSAQARQAGIRLGALNARERNVKYLMFACASLSVLAIMLIFLFILRESLPAIRQLGVRNLFLSADWSPNVSNPEAGSYGMLAFINGTIMTTLSAMLIGAPLGIGAAVFIDQFAPPSIAQVVRRGIELLAGIPSVIIGWFGLTLLVPFIARLTGSSGYGMLAASLVLVVMALPTITTLSAETLRSLPPELQEASVAMGATRWQTVYRVLIPAAREGLLIAVILGMGRAIGETMAVQMVIGNARQLTFSPLQRTSTLTSRIITDMGEATGVFRSALFAQALVLLILAMVLIVSIRLISRERKH